MEFFLGRGDAILISLRGTSNEVIVCPTDLTAKALGIVVKGEGARRSGIWTDPFGRSSMVSVYQAPEETQVNSAGKKG